VVLDFGDSVELAFRDALSDVFTFVPKLLGAAILLLVGWFLGKLVGGLVTRVLRAVRFNEVADKAEIDTFLQNAGVKMDPSAVVGAMARWFIYLVFFLAAFNALGLPQVSAVIDDVLAFLPKVVVALVILLAGALAGNLLAGVVRGALRSAGLEGQADLLGTIARFAVIAFAVIAALDMLQIAPTVVNGLWTAFLVLLVGTLVLAFGLGGRQAASDLWLGRLLRSELEPGVEVSASDYRGKVRAIGSLFTTLETEQGVVKIPNTELTGRPLQMSGEAYEQQVQKREQMKEKARQAMQSQQGQGGGQPSPPRPMQRTTVTPGAAAATAATGRGEPNGHGRPAGRGDHRPARHDGQGGWPGPAEPDGVGLWRRMPTLFRSPEPADHHSEHSGGTPGRGHPTTHVRTVRRRLRLARHEPNTVR